MTPSLLDLLIAAKKTNKILVKLPNFELENQKEYARYEKSMPIPRAISNNLSISIKKYGFSDIQFFFNFFYFLPLLKQFDS